MEGIMIPLSFWNKHVSTQYWISQYFGLGGRFQKAPNYRIIAINMENVSLNTINYLLIKTHIVTKDIKKYPWKMGFEVSIPFFLAQDEFSKVKKV